jgi:hypothetical protein
MGDAGPEIRNGLGAFLCVVRSMFGFISLCPVHVTSHHKSGQSESGNAR